MTYAIFGRDVAAVGNQLDPSVMFHPTFSSIAARLGFNRLTLDLATFGDEQDPRPFAKDDATACILRNECVERGASGVDVVRAGKRLRAFAGIVGFIDRQVVSVAKEIQSLEFRHVFDLALLADLANELTFKLAKPCADTATVERSVGLEADLLLGEPVSMPLRRGQAIFPRTGRDRSVRFDAAGIVGMAAGPGEGRRCKPERGHADARAVRTKMSRLLRSVTVTYSPKPNFSSLLSWKQIIRKGCPMRAAVMLLVPLTIAVLALSGCATSSSGNTTYAQTTGVDPDMGDDPGASGN